MSRRSGRWRLGGDVLWLGIGHFVGRHGLEEGDVALDFPTAAQRQDGRLAVDPDAPHRQVRPGRQRDQFSRRTTRQEQHEAPQRERGEWTEKHGTPV